MANFDLLKEQNPWWIAKEKILEDVHLEKLETVKFLWHPKIIDSISTGKDTIYTLRGSRQTGKTTALKLLTKRLLESSEKENILYFTCNNIDTHHELLDILQTYLDWREENGQRKFIFIDEVTFVKQWTRAIKHLSDLGRLRKCTLVLTGSNARDLKYEVERMPGRRGEDAELDRILFPVSFREYVQMAAPGIPELFSDITRAQKEFPYHKKDLARLLDNYLLTGGFIQAINSLAQSGKINIDIYHQYLSWTLGDLAKMGKREAWSRQIFEQVITSLTSNIGFDTIAKKTAIESHITVNDYMDVMESNFILKILYQIDISRKLPAARKSKKVYFQDPFLFWVFQGYVNGLSDYFAGSLSRLKNPELKSRLVENTVMCSLMRVENSLTWSNRVFLFRTANQVEVDFIVRGPGNRLLPIEVKYRGQAGPKDFLNPDKVNPGRGVIISKETFHTDVKKYIVPVEVFLLMQDSILEELAG